jgi:hypothetical protein
MSGIRSSMPALQHGIDLDATVSASTADTGPYDVRLRGKIGSYWQTVKTTRMTRSGHRPVLATSPCIRPHRAGSRATLALKTTL